MFHAPKNRVGAIIDTVLATVQKIAWISSQQESDSSTIVSSTSSAPSTPTPSSDIHSGKKYAIHTPSGNYLTAVNGGGMGEPANKLPFHTDATQLGPWEVFTIDLSDSGYYTIKTEKGNYVTAVNGGGMVGDPANTPLHTDATRIATWEKFALSNPRGSR